MKELGEGVYEINPGETVSMEFTPTGIAGDFIAGSLDGDTLNNVGSSTKPVFRFNVQEPPGHDYSCIIECSFPPGTSSSANVVMKVSGSNGGTTTPLTATASQPQFNPDFRVVGASSKKGGAAMTRAMTGGGSGAEKSAADKGGSEGGGKKASKTSQKGSAGGSKKSSKKGAGK